MVPICKTLRGNVKTFSFQDMTEELEWHVSDLAVFIDEHGGNALWLGLKQMYPKEYNILLLASLEMQAKELENLKANT